jgi:hypothetical protein
MGGYIGTKAVNLSTTGADINGDAIVDGSLTVGGAFTSLGIDDNATSTAITIDGSQNVGVGTLAPDSKMHINDSTGDAATQLILSTQAGGTDSKAGTLSFFRSNVATSLADIFYDAGNANLTLHAYDASFGKVTFNTAGSERMRIDASGNVGIGTTAPSNRFVVAEGTNQHGIEIIPGTTSYIQAYDRATSDYGDLKIDAQTLAFATDNGSERMRIGTNGTVLISKTAENINSKGVEFRTSGVGILTVIGNECMFLNRLTSTGTIVSFGFDGTVRGSISVTGSSTAYNTTSDYRLKDNITPIQGAGDIVKAMRPATYTFKADGSWADGFLAHELQELHPAAVTGYKDAMRDEEYEVTPAIKATYNPEGVELTPAEDAVMGTRSVPDYQGVDYSKLTPILTAALQEALTKIDELTARIETLEAK